MTFVLIAGGLALLLGGGEILVRGAVALARSLGVSPLVIGLTVVAFGTSAPELMVCVQAALTGHPDIVLGNVVGSNIANTLLIVGASAIILPLVVAPAVARREGSSLVIFTVLFVAICLSGVISRPLGGALVLLLAGYTFWSFRAARKDNHGAGDTAEEAVEELGPIPHSPVVGVLLTLGGIAAVVIGADLLIDGAVGIARAAGVSEAVIGLTLIAFGTSLPELATSVMAAFRRHADLAIGNVIGSNMFNMLGIAGVTAMVSPVPVPDQVVGYDLWVLLGVTALLVLLVVAFGRVSRPVGLAMIVAYCLYIFSLFGGGSAFVS